MAITSSNLNRFSEFFYGWKEKDFFSIKLTYYFPPHLTFVATLPLGIQNFKFRLMPKTHAPETGTENWYQKTGTSFLVPVFRTR